MRLSYHGHSVVGIETGGKKILIDPFITGNSLCDLQAADVEVDAILLTHGHNDHVGDTVEIAKRNNAQVVAPPELATYLGWQGVNAHPLNLGGAFEFAFGKVKLTKAFHGSSYTEEDRQNIVYTGMPSGILFTAEGKTVFHAGDTGLFTDMKMYGELNDIDLAFLPIGDNFTMGPDDAVIAAKWLNAKHVVPIHYNTFPVIKQNPNDYITKLEKAGLKGQVMNAGDSIEL